MLFLSKAMGGIQTPTVPGKIRDLMGNPQAFNEKLGSKSHSLFLSHFPKGSAKGLRFEGWSFNRVTFEEVEWDSLTFQNCTFSHCTFRIAKLKNTAFHNSPLHGMHFAGTEADSLTFEGGEWNDIRFSRTEGYDPDFRHITLKNLTWHKSQIHRVIGDHWNVLQCRIEGNDFKDMQLYDARFEKTLFQKNNFWNAKWERAAFIECMIQHNNSFGISGGRHFEKCQLQFDALPIIGGDGVDDDVLEQCHIELKDIGFTFSAGWGKGNTYENFRPPIYTPDGNLGFGFGLGGGKDGQCANNTYRNIKANDGWFGEEGTYRDCVFENIELDHMVLDWAVFENCTFRNLKVHKTIFVEDAHFINTTCENCVIDPGIEIIQNGEDLESFPGLPFVIPKP